MPKLQFRGDEVAKLHRHAEAAPERRVSFAHLCEKSLLKEGERMPSRGWADAGQIDPAKVEPHLLLVKDQGCYLMSGGLPVLPGDGTANACAYAEGLGPDCDWDAPVAACGGDDFAEPLPLRMFKAAVEAGAATGELPTLQATKTTGIYMTRTERYG